MHSEQLSAEAIANLSTDALKSRILAQVTGQDSSPMGQKVTFLRDRLLPFFNELTSRNPTPDPAQQIPLVQGTWLSVWSTIPFQDILPGRVHTQSYQIFSDNGLYANMARYRPGSKQPWLKWISQWLLSYDLMILQTYAVNENLEQTDASDSTANDAVNSAISGSVNGQWDIENVGIKQILRIGPEPLSVKSANVWFQKSVKDYQQQSLSEQQSVEIPKQGVDGKLEAKYEKVAKAKPQLVHLYIDQDFRLVKTVREKTQRPSYTIATRLVEPVS